ncbi:restriction endonuclease subunit S [Vibrio sp. 10N.222.54.F12]|uniref:restriction endonuclease subunit S n=1 Tax=Vibrio TaxID=662 RepID=UPI000C82AC89|nr:restriction endonuclease subunit S [Vibrio tasmaniensis]PML15359.1 restriction endonuclease subunit S [Vibrio tasmaniensis]PML46388.1 restriction endonuclease subunit S [Vibrio tasmaniensis]
MSFKQTPLNEFITLQRGFDLPKGDRVEGGIPVVASTGVGGYHNESKVKAPGVVIGRSGSIGGGQYITDDFWPLNTTLWIKDFKGHDPRYVYYLMRSIDFTKFNVGSGVPTLNRNHLSSLLVNELGVDKEKSIAKYLGDIDDKIDLNTQVNQNLEQMAQAIFKSWFVDFDPVKAKMNGEQPEGMDAATASLFSEKLVESELGLIPEGWTVKPFKKVIDKYVDNRGKTPPVVEDGIPLVEVKHLPENSAFPNLNTDKRVTEETFNTWFRVHVEPKDVLISTVGTIGRTSFVKNTNFGIAQNVLGLRFGKVVEPEYMFYTIKAHRFQHDMDARLVTTVQSSIKRKDLDTIDILVPPSNVQKEFCKLVGSLLDGQYSKNAENIELASVRDTLLPKLLSGEIDLGKTNSESIKEDV